MGGDPEGLLADFGNFANASLYVGKTTERDFAAIKDLQFRAVQRGPGAGRGVAAPDQVVNVLDRPAPLDARLCLAAPSFVSGLALVLHGLLVPTRDDKVGSLQHCLDAHWKELVEIDVTQGLVRPDLDLFLKDDWTFVEPVRGTKDRDTGPCLTLNHRPID